jgi:hypothetical protein
MNPKRSPNRHARLLAKGFDFARMLRRDAPKLSFIGKIIATPKELAKDLRKRIPCTMTASDVLGAPRRP